MKERLKTIGTTLLNVLLGLLYAPFAIMALFCGALALAVQKVFWAKQKDIDLEYYDDSLEKLIKMFV